MMYSAGSSILADTLFSKEEWSERKLTDVENFFCVISPGVTKVDYGDISTRHC